MGFKMRKSFKVAPGVRVNVGKKSAGISVGCKGLRYSVNSRTGARATASIPGTGMSYTTSSRSYSSSSYSRNNELKRLQKEQAKMEELERNRLEVELYENKIDMIQSIHKECDQSVNWIQLENSLPPFRFNEGEKGINELDAIQKLENYKPTFFGKILGKQEKETNKLKENIEIAKKEDEEEYKSWKNLVEVAKRINKQDIDTYFEVIDEFRPLDDLLEFGSGFEFFIDEPSWLEVDFDVNTDTVVPKEIKSLTKTGKVSTKQMTKSKYYDIQQDYICSCTLRIARDMFALLPIDYIVINALDDRLDTTTGKYNKEVVLSVKIDKDKLLNLNMDLIDPSDSMSNFECNMKFKKIGGLNIVDRIIK